jgi:hypothetical protein
MRRLACVLVLALGVSSSTALAAGGPQEFGLELMPSARKIGPQRYQSDRNYEATLKFFREKFRGSKNVRWMREVSVPGVKYVHLENDNPQSGWDGINITLQGDGAVTIYVLPRKQPGPAPSAASPAPAPPAARP